MRILIVIVLMVGLNAKAQIFFKNPSLEGQPCWGYCYPDEWSSCYTTGSVLNIDSPYFYNTIGFLQYPRYVIEGKSFFAFENEKQSQNFIEKGDLSQKLNCELYKFIDYKFEFYASKLMLFDSAGCMCFVNDSPGFVEVYIGNDSCQKSQLIHRSNVLDTFWQKQTVKFTPYSDYNWISFWPERNCDICMVDIGIDAFSPIYLLNAHAVDIVQADTVLEQSGQVYIEATPSIGSINSVFWIRVHNGGIDTVARQTYRYTATQSGTYIVAARDSIGGCAGVEWSFDTVRVSMPTSLDEIEDNEFYFYLYPNPKDAHTDVIYIQNSEAGSLQLYNSLGQLVIKQELKSIFNELSIGNLGSGIYTYKVQFEQGKMETGKLIIR